ncbi:MAG: hypothetical protein ACI36Y_03995 [Coriobacteriales bacterium]
MKGHVVSEIENGRTTACNECGEGAPCTGGSTKRTVVVEIPAPQGLLGLAPIISALLLAAAWGVVSIGYLCVPGSVAGAVLAIACVFMNLGGGIAQPALCLGIAVACAGLCLPLWQACQAGRRALVHISCRREGPVPTRPLSERMRRILIVSAIVAFVGCCIAGAATLAGGAEQLVLPDFLQALFSQEVPKPVLPDQTIPQPDVTAPEIPIEPTRAA